MEISKIKKSVASFAVLASLAIPTPARTIHEEAKDAQEAHDARHHTKAKVVGGSAVGGAVVGGVAGGATGTLVGGAVGAGGGVVANKIRKHHAIKKREQNGNY